MSNFHISTSRLDLHKPYIFNSNNILLNSEEGFKVKFWSHIFEEPFSVSNVCLHWEDTVPFIFKYTEAAPKVDLRIISTMSCEEGDHSLCEFSKIAESTNFTRIN
ncbi:uncharacterized protein RHIMIDRAFT_40411 [Rhizopus microsporus ATCC 52813]|uniref:Uncharacterized protein n=1 Tax=Rhizopus microsporus ATCC 52813 TaxID=1340429 RepID=A0A2G4SMC0_RHIZD|nr:uncharacterized protein RHIMIDRAFT_40411 [Rhizopus microsporus ATCC 52813]PHZ09905.1 hypothetical protein RHIMIDRAFT_40411 [Rhizopus microsporus ATCC 52813]